MGSHDTLPRLRDAEPCTQGQSGAPLAGVLTFLLAGRESEDDVLLFNKQQQQQQLRSRHAEKAVHEQNESSAPSYDDAYIRCRRSGRAAGRVQTWRDRAQAENQFLGRRR